MMRRPILPPVYFLASILLMLALHHLVPVVDWISGAGRWAGSSIVLGGLSLTLTCASMFCRRQTTIKPFEESSELVTQGPFRFSRNPMYLGLATTLLGVALLLGSVSPLAVVPLFVAALTTRIIVKEERMLEARFGEPYRDYRRRVRRWI